MPRRASIRIAIFASGGGSNARTILKYFQDRSIAEVVVLMSNNPRSGVVEFGPEHGIAIELLDKNQYKSGAYLLELLERYEIDLIVLAGYLKHIPSEVVHRFDKRILNIHPSLLPAYGGKGMYGMRVHEAVIAASEPISGLTIHFVNEVYDQGEILFQTEVKIEEGWTPKTLQQTILRQEHHYFPIIIEQVCTSMRDQLAIRSALISVYHKQGLETIIEQLIQHDVQIYSTGGTATYIREQGAEVFEVADLTGYPSILGGRVKTLHPKVHGGILARRDDPDDQAEIQNYKIPPIDLVIVDLYPFEETVSGGGTEEEIIEKIDIGGIALIRAAAKNFRDVVCIPSQEYYGELSDMLASQGGTITLDQRKAFAAASFDISSHYDTQIFRHLNPDSNHLKLSYRRPKTLRYGENPHQKGFFYGDLTEQFEQIHGKELSYNNLVDIDGALQLVDEFPDQAFFAIIKHTNPCGCATGENLLGAWKRALAGDPVSAFGGILACDGVIDAELASEMDKLFFEVLIAKEFSEEAKIILQKKKRRILLRRISKPTVTKVVRTVVHGMLVQDRDQQQTQADELMIKTSRQPNSQEIQDAIFGDTVCKHLKSNAIAIVKDGQLIGSGIGQTSRVDALKQAIRKAEEKGFDLKGSVMASDAFFPFSDCVEIAHEKGIEVVVEPGGSIRDEDSIKFCETHDMCLIFTGIRHFKH
ncbi:MAG: bifunctional phosphoribosylaminoimidazolecarboxamide formyltransferase/IMP cyclohydrolase [Bacteroidota bacterium]